MIVETSFKIIKLPGCACGKKINNMTRKINGVEYAVVDMPNNMITVAYDDVEVSADYIEEHLRNAGYQVDASIQKDV